MTLTEFAARRGVGKVAVSKAVAIGRLSASVGRDKFGRPFIADPDLADEEWVANTRQRSDRPVVERQSRGTPAWKSGDRNSSKTVVSAGSIPAPDTKSPRDARLPAGVPNYNISQAVRAQAAARREAALADMAELELAAQRGRLVDADQARADIFALISMAKTRLLGVPTLVAQDCPDIAARVVPLIDKRIRDALEELAVDG